MAWVPDPRKCPALPKGRSPSLLLNNLSCNADNFGYVSAGHAVVMSRAMDGMKCLDTGGADDETREMKFVTLNAEEALVVALTRGVQIWWGDGTRMTYFCELSKVLCMDSSDSDNHYCQGIAAVPGTSSLLVGTSTGAILHIEAELGHADPKIRLLGTLNAHDHPVMAIAVSAAGDIVASGDSLGNIYVWDGQTLEQQFRLSGSGQPITSLAMQGDSIIASYSTGHIRIFRVSVRELSCEIAAHSRPITAMALHPSLSVLATVSEDTFLNVWSLPSFESSTPQAELLFSEKVGCGMLLTGVIFLDSVGGLMVNAYDTNTLFRWRRG